jgi:hypothetical protein
MRKIITMTLLTLGLTGGVALADRHDEARRDEIRDHRDAREIHYRDYRVRPALRYEHHVDRHGFRWVSGGWRWNRYEWVWTPGYYVRVRF